MPKKGPSTIEERLNRAEGQLRAVRNMVQEETGLETEMIINQLQAVISSLESTKLEIIKREIKAQVVRALEQGIDRIK